MRSDAKENIALSFFIVSFKFGNIILLIVIRSSDGFFTRVDRVPKTLRLEEGHHGWCPRREVRAVADRNKVLNCVGHGVRELICGNRFVSTDIYIQATEKESGHVGAKIGVAATGPKSRESSPSPAALKAPAIGEMYASWTAAAQALSRAT